MTPTVFLFDIDGTILTAHGAGRRAMQAAFEAECPGQAEAMASVAFAGMTDPGIVRTALRRAEQPADDAQVQRVVEAYLRRIEAELGVNPPREIGGARAAIEAAERHAHAAVGLGTGNHVDGARYKLASVGLWDRFAFGGFGSDAEDRAQMLAVGRDRGLARLGADTARVVVIGDTPRDISAAVTIGAQCLAVTTGPHDASALEAADRVVDRLDHPAALQFLLG
ncbi:MAG: HAD family hydrolase [Nannocystaceae bacterium]|nr:HAD family hydrolase [bacterium]